MGNEGGGPESVRLASAASRWVLAVAVLGEAMVLLLLVFHTYVSVITTCQYVGGWLTGQWITGGIDPDAVHPGYFLPTAAGGLMPPVSWIASRYYLKARGGTLPEEPDSAL